MKIAFDEQAGTYMVLADAPVETAEMEQAGFLKGLVGFEPMGVPLGRAVVGGGLAFLVDRVIVQRIDPTGAKLGRIGQLGVAWAVKKFGSKYLGSSAADAAALILAYDAIADMVEAQLNRILPAGVAAGMGMDMAMGQRVESARTRYNEAF